MLMNEINEILTNENLNNSPTDIHFLPKFVDYLPLLNTKMYFKYLTVVNNLILNPFDLSSILTNEQLKIFCEFNIKCLENNELLEICSQNLAITLNNLYISKKEIHYSFCQIFNLPVKEQIFYKILLNLSKLNKIEMEIVLDKTGSINLLCLKIEIISYQAERGFLNLNSSINLIKEYLSNENTKVGWIVSHSLHRMIKNTSNKIKILNELKEEIEVKSANFWINFTNLLTLFLCENVFIEFEFYKEMLFYWKEDTKSELVRESALLYMDSLFKKKQIISFNEVYFIFLFDTSFRLKKLALNILNENIKEENLLFFLNEISFSNFKIEEKTKFLQKFISPLTVKENLIIFLNHPNNQIRKIAAKILQNYVLCIKEFVKNENLFFISGILAFINKKDCNDNCICDYEIEYLNDILIDDSFYNTKIYDFIVEEYLSIIHMHLKKEIFIFDTKKIIKNLTFILEKNSTNENIPFICKNLSLKNEEFSDLIFNKLKRSRKESFILANTFNFKHKKEIINIFLDRINETVLDSLYLLKKHSNFTLPKEFILKIEYFLEFYEVDFTGDKGMNLRLSSLKLINLIDDNIFNKYFIRYFVDKSKFIRDFLIFNCASKKEDFYFIKCLNFNFDISSEIYVFLEKYYEIYERKKKENHLGNDLLHFYCTLKCFICLVMNLKKSF
ncbi:beta-tubulin folding cofactor D [Tubulinosema ratisbonensis]|uniref:Beta-tubulin folding cofactor D n=1 Tax=Tubulinosema ratisbonensis TaxID=291195 RepID=A0A437AH70_9MICR|nr:beta-tubulin folding cofactor D [Tubulinosema ratisbonensis]